MSKLLGDAKRPEGHCRLGETYDAELSMCAPAIHTPLALDNAIMDTKIPACDSFFHSMCGKWIDQHTNENRAFSHGYRKNMERIRNIITSPDSGPVNDFYRSCVDTLVDRSRKSGKESALVQKHMLGGILGDLKLHADLPTVFGRLARAGYTAPFALSIERHPTRNELVPLFVWDGFEALNETVVRAVYARAGHAQPEAAASAGRLMRIASQLALHNVGPMSTIDDYVAYVRGNGPKRLEDDMTTVAALPTWSALADRYRGRCPTCVDEGWNRFFQAMDGQGLRFPADHPAWVIDHDYFRWLMGEGLTQFDIKEWRAYVEFSILYNARRFAPSLPSDVYFRQHDLQGPIGPGGRLHHRLPRHEHHGGALTPRDCVRLTHSMVPGLVARHFLDEYFPHKDEVRAEVRGMVENIRDVFVAQLGRTAWLDEGTRDASVAKLRAIKIRVAEPDTWIPEPFGNRISPDRWDNNMNMIRRYRVQQNVGLWHKDDPDELDRSAIAFFAMPLSSVNAYYSGPSNTITVLAGVLQHPFYNRAYGTISKYAILGAIIGHEMSHALDPNGILFDKDGRLPPAGWWSTQSANLFQGRSQCIIDEFRAPGGCEEANSEYGAATIGEDMADLTGLRLALQALSRQLERGLTAIETQHFFMVFSQLWCENYDQDHKCARVAQDEHAIAEYRVDKTLRQMGEFQHAFACHTGQAMYRPPGDRCVVYGEQK